MPNLLLYFSLLIPFFIILTYTFFKILIKDIIIGKISILVLVPILITFLFEYVLNLIYILSCYSLNICFTNEIIIEKSIFIKSSFLLSISIIGFLTGIYFAKKNILLIRKNIPKFNIFLPRNISFTINIIFFILIIFCIIYGLIFGDQYYSNFFSRLYNYIFWILIPPIFLFNFSRESRLDIRLLSISMLLIGLLLYITYGRGMNSMVYLFTSFLLFTISLNQEINLKSLFKNKYFKFFIIFLLSTTIYILISKVIEIYFGLSLSVPNLENKTFGDKLPFLFIQSIQVLGIPKMAIWHQVYSHNNISPLIPLHQFIPSLYPSIISEWFPRDLQIWHATLANKLLNVNHEGFGGFNFGSGIALYSYGPLIFSSSLAFLISMFNSFLIYGFGSELQHLIRTNKTNLSKNNIFLNTRPLIFLLVHFELNSTISQSFFNDIIIVLPFYILSRYFSKSKFQF